ncbi:MAG: hypothetical protein ACKVVT_09735 [Dehalococcoidia bacterium]
MSDRVPLAQPALLQDFPGYLDALAGTFRTQESELADELQRYLQHRQDQFESYGRIKTGREDPRLSALGNTVAARLDEVVAVFAGAFASEHTQ